MSIDAVYRKGVFQPLEPVALPEDAEVRLQIISKEHEPGEQRPSQSFFEALGTRHFLPPAEGWEETPEDFREYMP